MTSLDEAEVGYVIDKAVLSAEIAMYKFPQPNYVCAKLAEEAGEVIRAYIHRAESRATTEQFEAECVQLIGLVLRLMFEGDQTVDDAARAMWGDAPPKQGDII